jgi:hypothetical protein
VRAFFDLTKEIDYESQYFSIWNQIFLLKEYCGLSLEEQNMMTSEERTWYLNRYNEEVEKRNEQQRKAQSSHTSIRR